jgi:hypothetical protein
VRRARSSVADSWARKPDVREGQRPLVLATLRVRSSCRTAKRVRPRTSRGGSRDPSPSTATSTARTPPVATSCPPLWLMNDYEALARAGRPTANLVTNLPLPAGTDSINVPKVATGTATAIQTADNQSVQETDLADTSVSAGVKTIAGQQDVSIQAARTEPGQLRPVIFADLVRGLRDEGRRAGAQRLERVGSGQGHPRRIRHQRGDVHRHHADGRRALLQDRGRDAGPHGSVPRADVIVMHPRRWAWLLAATDSTNRPLVVPNAQGPMNAIGSSRACSRAGRRFDSGPCRSSPTRRSRRPRRRHERRPHHRDACFRLYLWESAVKTRVLPESAAAR